MFPDIAWLPATKSPDVVIAVDDEGFPSASSATERIAASPARVWRAISSLDRYAGVVPMVDKIVKRGERVEVHLKFKLSVLGVSFMFLADVHTDEGRSIELVGVSGEPRNAHIRFDLAPVDDDADATVLRAAIGFDVLSLGWLAKTFLRFHPEIRFGIIAGSALVLLDGIKRGLQR